MYDLGKEEIIELEKLFSSKKLFRYQGKGVDTNTSLFEKEFSTYIGQSHSLFVTSGTNALFLALKVLGIGPGDEVLVPVYAFVATISAIQQVGATPVLVGIGKDLTMDLGTIRSKVSKKTRAIIPVHMDGLQCHMETVMSFAKENKLLVIEDVAQAVGGSINGQKLGSYGDASCFSFNVDKIISCGEGGIVCFKEEEKYREAILMHDAPVRFGSTFKDQFLSSDSPLGYSMRVSEISSVIMRQQLKKLDVILKKLRDQKRVFVEQMKQSEIDLISSCDQAGECSTHLHLKLSDPLVASQLAKDLSSAGILAYPLYARPAYCYWQWVSFLGLSKVEENELALEFAEDRLFLSSVVKIPIQYEDSLQETRSKALLLEQLSLKR